jgi:hypothetical protein
MDPWTDLTPWLAPVLFRTLGARAVRHAEQTRLVRHRGDPHEPDEAAAVVEVRLNHVEPAASLRLRKNLIRHDHLICNFELRQ